MSPPKLPPAISDAVEDAIEAWGKELDATTGRFFGAAPGFRQGVRWLYAHLAQAAGEFDEQAACEQLDTWAISDRQETGIVWLKGARWQHSQMAAQVGAYEQRAMNAENHADIADQRCQRLERELAEAKAEIERRKQLVIDLNPGSK